VSFTLDTDVVPTVRAPQVSFDELRPRLTGSVHTPDEPEYQALVTPWNLAIQLHPAAVVDVRTAHDVVAAVRFAAEHGLTAGVQATGHGAQPGIAGHLLIVTKGLDEVTVHPEGWARVGAGVKWLEVIEQAAPYGLAPLNGSSSDVGVVGYTTGGGVGPLVRTFGLAADRVRAFDVVTGDGLLRRVTPDEHPDLFFALRGGKGTAGIVTAIEFDLLRLSHFYGGAIYFDAADAAVVVDRWRTWADTLPEQATTSFALFNLPPLPEIPPPLAGRMTLAIRFAWTGQPEEGARLLDEIRALAPVVLDDASYRPYTEIDHVHNDPVDPTPAADPAILLDDFPAEAAERLLAVAGHGSGSPQILLEVRALGGAYAREARYPNAFSHRAARYSVLCVGIMPSEAVPAHTQRVFDALADWDTGGCWPNFVAPHDGASARRAYSSATLARLAEVADRYDPDGVLATGAFARS
jgi:FAD binding domain